MDDLDHSIHIAEYDWSSFYDESEECNLLQPSLAYSDDSDLSDSEDSGNSSLVYSHCQQETQRSPDAESNTAEERCTGSAKLPEQLNQSDNRGPVNNVATSVKQVEECASYPTINKDAVQMELTQEITEMSDSILKTLQTDPLNVWCSGETKEQTKDCILQTESDLKSTKEPDPLSCNQVGLRVSELDITARAVSVIKAEKERWFVTVNDNPTQQRGRSTSCKKKRKIKKPSEGSCTYSLRQESSAENGVEMKKDKHESDGGRDAQSSQTKKPRGHPCEQIKTVQDILESSEKLLVPQSENITEEVINRSKYESDSSASASSDTFMPPQVEHVQSDELEDSAELFSIHSYDSETYLSAAESTEEPQCPLQCYLKEHPQSSLSPTCDRLGEKTDTEQAKGRQMYSQESALSSDDCEDYESTSGESPVMFPSADQAVIETSDDDSTCKNDPPVETTGPQTLSADLSESACFQGGQLAPLSVSNLTVSPCSMADSPETYAKTAGHSQPIYAISAFWDEMEKLTINDILQLRMGINLPPKQTQETLTPNADVFSINHSSNVGPVDYGLADSSLIDTSDTADSDYFTQTDEAKPDHSSYEFSTSDFEEKYWQFIKTNRNPIPDHNSNNQERNYSSFSHEDNSTNSEGRDTPMPLEDGAGQLFDSQESQTLTSWPRRLTKSNSMYNVQALKTENLSLLPLLSHDSSLSISRPLPLEENVDLEASSGLETLIPASFCSFTDLLNTHYQISFPEMFKYFFTEDNTNTESLYAAAYDPEDISVAPVFDHNLCSFGEDASSSPLQCNMEKPIPIFSCSHPTVRELTFPKQHYVLSANCEEMDKISHFRVVSSSSIQTDLLRCSSVVVGGSRSWKSLLSLRKICFHDKGSIWCRGSGAWMFPGENEEIPVRRENQTAVVLNERRICPASSQVYRELKEQQRILETICIKREGIFSSVKQSDMCLVCIAFASWVLRSSDPEGADAWKAALLANVSALSAIQYLRHYVKKKDPPDDI